MQVVDFLDEFMQALEEQLHGDNERWGDTWLDRGTVGQEKRTFERYRDYYDMFQNGGT